MSELSDLLVRQHGLLTRAQLVAAGLSPARIDERVRTRAWRPVLPRTYVVAPGPAGDELRVRAAVLWAGQDAVLTGLAAAWWLGFVASAPMPIRVAAPHRARDLRRPEVVATARRPVDVTHVRGIRVTAAPLTLLDAAVELGSAGIELLERAGAGVAPAGRATDGPAGAAWLLRDLRHMRQARRVPDRVPVGGCRPVAGSDGAPAGCAPAHLPGRPGPQAGYRVS
ncbi:MAG: hypothetical protein L0H84_01355 [Pseudonocardia sp.]|nr:hypothetical protein [Pseudonocardia sp.]